MALFCREFILGISIPLVVLLISSMALLSAAVPLLFIEMPCAVEVVKDRSARTTGVQVCISIYTMSFFILKI